MTMVHRIRVLRAVLWFAGWIGAAACTLAADPPMHNGAGAPMPPGAVGRSQLERGGPLPGYFQPIEITAPPGAAISLAVNDQFTEPMPAPVKAGMLIGAVYRLRVIRIPQHEGLEVFPTIEVIDRLYPPRGQELRFPVPVELTQEDLEIAAQGSFVTRVIYLENPHEAIPGQSDPVHQSWFDAPPQDDPLSVASGMGRPMVILRIGSRTPDDSQQPDSQFLYHSPPLLMLAAGPHPPTVRQAEPVPAPLPKSQPKSQPKASPKLPANPAEPAVPSPPAPLPDQSSLKSSTSRSRVTQASAIEEIPSSALQAEPQADAPEAPEPPQVQPASPPAAEPIIRGQEPAQSCPTGPRLPEEAYRGYPGDGYTDAGYVPEFMRPEGGVAGPPLPSSTFGPWKPSGITCPWPKDEYICDGGERGALIRVRPDWHIDGMQPEDTFVHYDTIDGRTLFQTSNRVCIYAPRFGAVRKVDVAHSDNDFEGLHKLNQPIRPSLANEWQPASTSSQPLGPIGEVGTRPVIALVEKQTGIDLHNEQSLAAVYDQLKPYEDFSYIRSGIIATEDKPILAQRVQSAIAWTGNQALEIQMEGKRASAVTGDVRAEAEFVVDVPNHPRLQVCKIASANNALPGETVDFTIRFDNVGDQKIGNVSIVDSLTTRLDYVAGSEKSSMKATFTAKPNEAGSVVLKWDLTDPVPANGGGAVHFQCRVR
jgi:uncharacterized repeat protein (TIGR01451 family)